MGAHLQSPGTTLGIPIGTADPVPAFGQIQRAQKPEAGSDLIEIVMPAPKSADGWNKSGADELELLSKSELMRH